VTIPAEIGRRLSIRAGDRVEVDEEAGGIMIRPARSLAALVSAWDDLGPDASEAEVARAVSEERHKRSESL
jgi:AbrB family looped-hinge helix DNA binding protein